jgi:hypothetical protein
MKIAIVFITDHYRGDHAADVCIAYESIPGETIEQLIERVGLEEFYHHIEIRLMKEVE